MVFHPPNPGFSNGTDLSEARSFKEFKSMINDGCVSDGLINVGTSCPPQKSGHSIARVLFSEEGQDYHFETLNKNGRWEWKTLAEGVYEREGDDGINGYTVDSYFYVPDRMENVNLQPGCEDFITVDGQGKRFDIKIMQTTDHELNCVLVPYNSDDDFLFVTQKDGSSPHILPLTDLPAGIVNDIFDVRDHEEPDL